MLIASRGEWISEYVMLLYCRFLCSSSLSLNLKAQSLGEGEMLIDYLFVCLFEDEMW